MSSIRAVLVGVNEYRRPDIPSLRGCVNDVLLVRALLRRWFGVENRQIRVVVDERATKEGILQRLGETLSAAQPGDLVVFYFSGHGSQIRDRDGDELADGLDELLCPHDMDWDERRYIVDDEIDRVVASAPRDVLVEAFFDCCFGGAAPPPIAHLSGVPAAGPPVRFAPPPVDIYARGDGDQLPLSALASGLRLEEGNVAWAASAENMPASEIEVEGGVYGLFTYWGCRSIWEYAARGELRRRTREELVAQIRRILADLKTDQRPAVFASRALLHEPPLTPVAPHGARPRSASASAAP
jgi:hypothetical protein